MTDNNQNQNLERASLALAASLGADGSEVSADAAALLFQVGALLAASVDAASNANDALEQSNTRVALAESALVEARGAQAYARARAESTARDLSDALLATMTAPLSAALHHHAIVAATPEEDQP